MDSYQFTNFFENLRKLGAAGVGKPEFVLGRSGKYELQYIPFEHVNTDAKLVIVGITPGTTQLNLAYAAAQLLLKKGLPESKIVWEVKKVGAFGGPSMKPNLLKMLRHFHFDKLLGIQDVESLWGKDAELLHSTSVVPHAAFRNRDMFNGSFSEVMASPLLKECFLDCFVSSLRSVLCLWTQFGRYSFRNSLAGFFIERGNICSIFFPERTSPANESIDFARGISQIDSR